MVSGLFNSFDKSRELKTKHMAMIKKISSIWKWRDLFNTVKCLAFTSWLLSKLLEMQETITGVSDSISNDDLEETAVKIFDKLDLSIDSSCTEDCHWLS